jgi:hypothetical protein
MKIQGLLILAEELVERGFVLETRAPVKRRGGREVEIEVGNTQAPEGDGDYVEQSTNYYLECIRQDRLSWLLFDGSIVQVLYRLRGRDLAFHRYCYIPAPFDVDLRASPDFGELIESASSSNPLNTAHRSMLRFEFDPDAGTDEHPAAHLHLNSPHCRIPMRGPISVKDFILFLVTFIYPLFFAPDFGIGFEYTSTITEIEERTFHLNWRRPIQNRARQ